jgi:serine/threonine-protein kinase
MPICPQCGARHATLAAQCIKDGARFIEDAAWQASRQDPRLGRALNERFALVAPLESGSMGEVYAAVDLHIVRRAAVKVLREDLTHDQVLVRRFRREADAISRMHHSNIVQLYAFGHDLETHYIAMEFVEGKTLASFSPYVQLSRALTLHLMHQLLLGLAEAHQQQIIHRDLKPENIFLCARPDQPYQAKILDFGVAKLAEAGTDHTALTMTGEVFGTPLYISPEQATAQGQVSPATDLYSLSVIFYELLSGAPPFNAPTALATMMQHVHAPPPPLTLRPLLGDLSPDLLALVTRNLAKDPAARDPSAGDALSAFLATEEGRSVTAPPTASSASSSAVSQLAWPPEAAPEAAPAPTTAPPLTRPTPAHTRTILYGQPALKLNQPTTRSPYASSPPPDDDDTSPDPLPPIDLPEDPPEPTLEAQDLATPDHTPD